MSRAANIRIARPIPESMADSMRVSANIKPPTHEQVALRAYERWEQAGCQPGSTDLNWVEAERALAGASL